MICSFIVNNNETKSYPCLKIQDNSVVLFTEKNKGMLLTEAPTCAYKLGEIKDDWAEFNFRLFTGELVLKNKC